MKFGEQNESLVTRRMLDAMVDIYWGIITPTQALMMLAGHAPPVPKTMVQDVQKVLVDGEKVMGLSELKFLERVIKLYKDHEHGKLKTIPGKEIDDLLVESKKYDIKLKEIRKKLEDRLIIYDAERSYSEVFGLLEKIFGKKSAEQLVKDAEHELIANGKLQPRFAKSLKSIINMKSKVKGGKVTQLEMNALRRDATELINELLNYAQRADLVMTEKGVLQISFGDKKGELALTDGGVFFVEAGRVMKIENGKFSVSNKQILEKAIIDTKDRAQLALSSEIIDALHKELGKFSINF